jgi:phosphatidylserine/phosphatidylglycerophosphate/cardiolipin synthase-like enzyme
MDPRPVMEPSRNCWRVEQSQRFSFIVDGAAYFVAARAAMLKARRSILLIGWDFDARLDLGGGQDDGPARLGDFILWLVERTPSLEIRLLRWDTGALMSLFRGRTAWWVLRWKLHPRITLRLDSAHPLTSSHHQKIAVIDDCMAFCGGIDMTSGRWDTPQHLDHDPRRIGPNGRDGGPWHDATSAFDGPAARAMGDLARARWLAATGETLAPCEADHDCWPEGLAPSFLDTRLAIARTLPKYGDAPGVHEVEQAYVDLIASARKVIYAESQYFASRRIARAIAERLIEDDGPEVVIVNPHTAEGWLEALAMDTARARLIEALQKIDHYNRLRIYHPVAQGGAEIYVHAKIAIVDDQFLRVGSSNFNNRSLRLDSECDVILAAADDAERAGIAAVRDSLLAEHLGVTPAAVAAMFGETGSLIRTIEALRGAGRSLVPYELPRTTRVVAWLAENEILDPNGPDEIFESPARRGLFKGWDRLRDRLRRKRRRRSAAIVDALMGGGPQTRQGGWQVQHDRAALCRDSAAPTSAGEVGDSVAASRDRQS